MFRWKRIRAGNYQALRDGKLVATAKLLNCTGTPQWELAVFDGTELARSSTGFQREVFYTLTDAKFAYGRAYRLAHQND